MLSENVKVWLRCRYFLVGEDTVCSRAEEEQREVGLAAASGLMSPVG